MNRMLPLFALLTATVACAPSDNAELVVDPGLQGREVTTETVAMHVTIDDAYGPVHGAMVCGAVDCVSAPDGEVTLHLPAGRTSEVQVIGWDHTPTRLTWEAPEHDGVLTVKLLSRDVASWDGELRRMGSEIATHDGTLHRIAGDVATRDGALRRPGHVATWDGELHHLVVSDEGSTHVELEADAAGEMVSVRFDG